MRNSIRLIILFLLFSFSAFSQWRPSPYNWEYYGLKVDGPFILPNYSSDPPLLQDGALRYNGADVQLRKSGVWITIAKGVLLDSARRSNDTLYFRRTNGEELAVKIQGLPISATTGLADSLLNIRLSGIMDTVFTISGLQAYSGSARLIYVKDSIRGGLFYHRGTGVPDGGTVFAGTSGYWKRQYNRGIVHVGWWGGKTDIEIQAAITAADTGGIIYLQPRSRYIVSGMILPLNGQRIEGQYDTLQRCNEVKAILTSAIATGSGTRTFTVNNGSGFASGMYVNFYSAAVGNGSSVVHKILTVSGNTITTDAVNTYDQAWSVGDTVITEFAMIANPLGGGAYLKNIALSRIVFDGNKANNTSHIFWAFNPSVSLYVDGGKIEDCEFINSKADGAIVGGINPHVDHCRFTDGNSNGVHLSGSYTPVISNCYFYNNNLNTATAHNEGHITFSDSIFQANIYANYFRKTTLSGIGSLDNPYSGNTDASIHDNVFDSCVFASIFIGNGIVGNPNIVNFTISNNRMINCGSLRVSGISQTTIDRTKGPGRVTITGNYFLNSSLLLSRSNNINVSANTFYKAAAATLTQNTWVSMIDNENVTIVGNHFYNHTYALSCDNSSTTTGTYKDKGYMIADNNFIDQSIRSINFMSKNSGTFENVKISGNNFKNSVTGNSVVNIGSGIEFSNNTMNLTGSSTSCAIATQITLSNWLDSCNNVVIKNNYIKINYGFAIKVGYGKGIMILNNQYNIGTGTGIMGPVIDSSAGTAYFAFNKIIDSSYVMIGAAKITAGLPGLGKVFTDTSGRGDGVWRTPTVTTPTLDQVLTSGSTSTQNMSVGNVTAKHLIGSGTPTVSIGSDFTGTASVSGNDIAGTVTVTITGSTSYPTLAAYFQLNFATAYASAPTVVFVPANSATALLSGTYLKLPTTSSFQIASAPAGTSPGSATYVWNYHVIQ